VGAIGEGRSNPVLRGASLCALSCMLFAIQDATIKWLVADHSVFEVLFWRSAFVLCVCFAWGRSRLFLSALRAPARWLMVWRALIACGAWLLYYTGAKEVSLAQMSTLYFSAPIIVTVLAIFLLGERAGLLQWLIILFGFAGVVVASQPGAFNGSLATGMILVAAVLWAYGFILIRKQASLMPLVEQVLLTNLVFLLLMATALPWHWSESSWQSMLLMLCVGVCGGAAQLLLFSSFAQAPASVLAPFEYTGLVWAFLLSWLIWGDVPSLQLIIGACLIALSGIAGVYVAARQGR